MFRSWRQGQIRSGSARAASGNLLLPLPLQDHLHFRRRLVLDGAGSPAHPLPSVIGARGEDSEQAQVRYGASEGSPYSSQE